jgi:arsenite-transporting ATPase
VTPRFIFYGGKGGVGKTTCASAFALASAFTPPAPRVLLVSTDPAHSLGDVFGVALSSAPKRIRPSLDAVELDASRAFARWLHEHRRPLGEILEHGTWLDRADVDALLDLSIPGVDELAGILEIARLADDRLKGPRASYDLIVVDTAPTGHTLRLLSAPATVAAVAGVLDALQQQHRLIREQLARVGGRPEASDRLIALLAQQARDTAARLQDPAQTAFHWVMLPEELSLAETEDGIGALERGGMSVPEITVNRALADAPPCPVCDRRRADERRVIGAIARRLGRGRLVRVIPDALREPRGVAALKKIAAELTRKGVITKSREKTKRTARTTGVAFSLPSTPRALRGEGVMTPESLDAFRSASLLFFGGKGGVGKTTVSAATAMRLARADPKRRVLLLSTDPAHSLADVFQTTVDDTPRAIRGAPKNLVVRELDAAKAFAERREQFDAALDEIASALGAATADAASARTGLSIQSPATAASDLMNLAPPGIDELFGVLSVVDARASYDVIVVDTAPTGHALRLLEMPDTAREWMQVLLRMLLKYKSMVRPGRLAEELVDVSKSVRELQALLRDAAQTRFIVVTRAAEVPRHETGRLLARLRRLHLSSPAVVVNALTLGPRQCAWCRAVAAAERRELAALRRLCGRRCAIIETPRAAPPPRGTRALEEWARTWIGEGLKAQRTAHGAQGTGQRAKAVKRADR